MDLKDWVPPLFQRKATQINRMIAAWFVGQPVWTPVDYENLAKEGFQQNVWVYRSIMAVAQAASSVPWALYRNQTKNVKEIDAHPLLDLLESPNPYMSKQEFFEALIAYELLSGNSYMQYAGPKTGPPKELWLWRPDRVKVIPDKKNLIAGYRYSVHGMHQDFDNREVSHFKLFSPIDDWYGLSQIQVAARGIDADNAANAWNAAMFQNGSRPSGAMTTENELTDDQYERLKTEIGSQYSGAKNAGRPMLLEGGLDWKQMSLSPKDMDFIESKKLSRLEICAAFGVPPELLGDHEHATYSNYQEARQAFYQDTVLPILTRIRDKLNTDLVPKFADNLYLDINKDKIEALQENRDAVWSRANNAVKIGLLTVNEARHSMGYEDIDGGEVRYVPTNVLLEGEDAPDYASLSGESNPKPDGGEGKSLEIKAVNLVTEAEKTLYWKAVDRRRMGYYGSVAQKIRQYFQKEMTVVLERFDDLGEPGAVEAVDSFQRELKKTLTAVYVSMIQTFGATVYDQLTDQTRSLKTAQPDDQGFDAYAQAVQQFIAATVAQKVVEISGTTKDLIRAVVQQGFDEALSLPDIRDKIASLYLKDIIPNRAMTIARTEVIGASNAGSRQAAKQTGLALEKEWIATRDGRTRLSHKHVDGEIKNMDERYSNGLMFPGDPTGAPGEVINCRCTEGFHGKS